jgi:hypothetical protein
MSAVAAEIPVASDASDVAALHQRLLRLGQQRLRPVLTRDLPTHDFPSSSLAAEMGDRYAEESFVAAERAAVAPLLRDVPSDADAFLEWFEGLRETGPGQHDPLFPWLAERASIDEMRWFLGQEFAGEAGFEDLLALTQLRMPVQPKLEMARNYWDELGRGHASGMHGPMLERLAQALVLELPVERIVWQSLALANLMVALAWNRHYAFQSVGALGVIELTAPGRAKLVNAGLRRLGAEPGVRQYFALHATLDVQHSRDWNREIVRPLVAAEPRRAVAIAEGALLRLRAGARCFATYRTHLGVD